MLVHYDHFYFLVSNCEDEEKRKTTGTNTVRTYYFLITFRIRQTKLQRRKKSDSFIQKIRNKVQKHENFYRMKEKRQKKEEKIINYIWSLRLPFVLRRSIEKYCCDCNTRQENDYQLLIKDFHHEIRTAKDDDKRAEQESRTERRNEKVPSKRRSGNERKRNEKVRMMKNCMRLHVNFCVSLVHPFICYI